MRKLHDMAVAGLASVTARSATAESGIPTAPRRRYAWQAGICAALGLFFIIAAYPTVSAHTGAIGVVKERMDLMKALGGAMKQLNAMFANQKPYDAEQVEARGRGRRKARWGPDDPPVSRSARKEAKRSLAGDLAELDRIPGLGRSAQDLRDGPCRRSQQRTRPHVRTGWHDGTRRHDGPRQK